MMDFNAYWAALPTGGGHDLWTESKCNEWEGWNSQKWNRSMVVMMTVGDARSVTGVHGCVTEAEKCIGRA